MPVSINTQAVRATIDRLRELGESSIEIHAKGMHKPRQEHHDAKRAAREAAGKKVGKRKVFRRAARRAAVSNAALFVWHEFGFGVPMRSWIRRGLREHAPAISKAIATQVQAIVASKGKREVTAVHKAVGKIAIEGLRRTVMQRIPPPLADATKANPDRDKRHIPLLDTGQMRDALTWESGGPA